MTSRSGRRAWAWACIAATLAFAALLGIVALFWIPSAERAAYAGVTAMLPKTPGSLFVPITRLGTGSYLAAGLVVLISVLPGRLRRRWWLCVAVMLAVTVLELAFKELVGRPRPFATSHGFPSGHTAATTAFSLMVAYVAASALERRGAKALVYGSAACWIALVGVSRIVLHKHWPLDVLGGSALGVAVGAGALWWHESAEPGIAPHGRVAIALRAWLGRWQALVPLPFLVLLFEFPPLAEGSPGLDLVFDATGGCLVAAGLVLRLWAVSHCGAQRWSRQPEALVVTGPYALMRHPLWLAQCLIVLGIALLAESGPGFILLVGVVILVHRLTVPEEEQRMAERFGRGYADYCGRVPVLPRLTPSALRAVALSPRWGALRADLPAVASFAALAIATDLLR
jgi:undecaprenyl-diphosphatase